LRKTKSEALEAKRLDLLNELVTPTASIGALVNPQFRDADRQLHELQEAATVLKKENPNIARRQQ
jgi:hypothetical protein